MGSKHSQADFLVFQKSRILDEYEDRLRIGRNGLLRYPETRQKCLDDAAAILADLSVRLDGGAVAHSSGPVLKDLRSADLLDAANTLFEVLIDEAAQDPGIPLKEFALAANAVIYRRLSRELAHHMLQVFDRAEAVYLDERYRMARDLHDRIGGDIAAVLRNLEASPHEDRSFTVARDLVRGVLEELRWVISGLRPPRMPTGFAHALELYCDIECSAGVTTEVSVTGEAQWLDAVTRYEIFLILREAMRNSFKHGSASRVTVTIEITDRRLHAIVADDGTGFQRRRTGGVGLSLMSERAEVLGGTVEVNSRLGEGTTMELVIPRQGTSKGQTGEQGAADE
jgi:signal transduction histidine kinase